MDSFTLNKIAGAVLGTCLVGMGIGLLSEGYFFPGPPKKPGYALPEPKEEAKGGAEKPAGIAPIAVRLEKADPKKGESDAKVCGACHNFEEGAGAKIGPDLYGVVERDKGSAQGFDYSAGMKKKGGKWTFADLDTFITKPSAYVEGTKMSYSGESNPDKRAEIIAYLHTLSKNPVPLPKVSDADKKAAEGDGKQADAGKADEKKADAGGDAEIVKAVAAGDASKGKADAQICSACHNLEKGGGALVGPPLWGVVDRDKGSVAGFDYSAGMKKKGGKWTYADLNQFITKPSAYVQGTKMGFSGEGNAKKRADIIAFLRTLSDNPAPLPGGDAAKPADKKTEAAPAPTDKKTEAAPPAPAEKKTEAAPPVPAEKKTEAAPPAPTEKKTEAAPPAPTEKKTEAAPPAPAEKKADVAPAKPDEGTKTATVAPAANEGPSPTLAADPMYPTEKVEATLPQPTGEQPSLKPSWDKTEAATGAPEPYSAPAPDDAK